MEAYIDGLWLVGIGFMVAGAVAGVSSAGASVECLAIFFIWAGATRFPPHIPGRPWVVALSTPSIPRSCPVAVRQPLRTGGPDERRRTGHSVLEGQNPYSGGSSAGCDGVEPLY
ncbi:hypothetical protein [Sulfobacillus thermosulfidooxidans]|uniref:hypothetical protein n=1 Tax=Sulfobacillus thermosulfidooxidans TaxID=28034 RepID=UPI0006B62511|nr:hypothetical protein [Sulfobacillus thermosulfidooxidans]